MLNSKSKKIIAGAIMAILVFQLVGVLFFAPKKAQAIEGPAFYARWAWDKIIRIAEKAYDLATGQALTSALMSYSSTFGTNLAKNLVSGGPGGRPMQLTDALTTSANKAGENARSEFITIIAQGREGTCNKMPLKYMNKACYNDDDCNLKNISPSEWETIVDSNDPNALGPGSWTCPTECATATSTPAIACGCNYTGGECVGGKEGLNATLGGFNLCAPAHPSAQEYYTLYWANSYNPPAPKCSWSEVRKKWEEFAKTATSDEILEQYSVSFDVQEMDISTMAQMGAIAEANKEEASNTLLSLYNSIDDFKPGITAVSRMKEVTATTNRNKQRMIDEMPQIQQQAQATATAIKTAGNMYSVFTSAFMSNVAILMQSKIKDYIINKLKGTGDDDLSNPNSIAKGPGVREAEEIFSQLLTVRVKSGAEVDLTRAFATCPADTRFAGVNNCVIDQGLSQAISDKMTIAKALERGYLHGDWFVASPDASDGASDYLSNYSLTNIKKLRNARIMPLGLEIAASMIKNRDASLPPDTNKVTLNTIIGDYNKIGSPWYHLADPDWILDAPDARCAAQTYSAVPESNSSNRQESCTALEFCIDKDEKGACRDWGFCTKEKVAFDFNGETCPSYYASCQTYKRAGDNKEFNYLKDSLSAGTCGEDNYGCQWYSNYAVRDAAEDFAGVLEWQSSTPWRLYLNHNAAKCDPKEVGCAQFLRLRDNNGYLLGHLPPATTPSDASPLQVAINEASESEDYYDNFKVEELYLKKAPDYLKCYDADLTNNDPNCADYATQCSAAEVGCNRYTPTAGGPWVPAVASPADFCPSECNNYENFYRAPLWWDNSDNYIWTAGFDSLIPTTAKKCNAQAVGCEEYTNLDVVAAGGEGREYYSQARVCQKTDNGLCSPYYTWEGDDRVGYQLKSYNLIKSYTGAPCVKLSTDEDGGDTSGRTCAGRAGVADLSAACSRGYCSGDATTDGRACNTDDTCGTGTCVIDNPDCYQFYDAAGEVYYASKIKTITCNNDCHVYRKNDLNTCAPKADGTPGNCLVALLASEGQKCTAAAAGCREYRGNTAGNVRNTFSDDFEDGSVGYWDSSVFSGHTGGVPAVSLTSLYVGGNSLQAKNNSALSAVVERDVTDLIQNEKSYTLSFLVKADQANLEGENNLNKLRIQFKGHDAPSEVFASAQPFNTEWQVLTVGPVYTDDWGAGVTALQFINSTANHAASDFYLDNVILKEVQASQFLIKDSWTTPVSCNTNFGDLNDADDDSFSPGFMAGCRSYKNNDGMLVYLKSFTSLCSSDKAGCKALVNTQNSYLVPSKTYNDEGTTDDDVDDVTVPADEVIYLVDDKDKRCASKNKGCTLLGQPSGTTYNNVSLINDPDLYLNSAADLINKAILCKAEQSGCQKYATSDGGAAYFIDPGGETCDYKIDADYDGGKVTGWFKTATDGTLTPCALKTDLATGKKLPFWGLTGSGAGNCTRANDKCTAFADPTGPLGANEIYYIKDKKLTDNTCNGMVSRNSGCWLYSDLSQKDSTGRVNNAWNATSTYKKSSDDGNKPVSPVLAIDVARGDANIILQQKIEGRGCAEWLACRSWEYQWDQNVSQYKKICTQLGRCNKLGGKNNSCAPDGWVDSGQTDMTCRTQADCGDSFETGLICIKAGAAANGTCIPENMTAAAYKSREVAYNYFGSEYSGYSLFGIYPLDLLQEKQYNTSTDNGYYLTGIVKGVDSGLTNKICTTDNDCQNATTGFVCQKTTPTGDGHCVIDKSCRGFPEADAPFAKNTAYANVNKCAVDGKGGAIGDDCQCSYKKVQYAGENKYYNYNQDAPLGVCSAGKSDLIGQACAQTSDCCGGAAGYDTEKMICTGTNETPICSYKTREDTLYGWPGTCLEFDPSKKDTGACITWFPTDRLPSDRDIYNTHPEAGYFATAGKQWYCLADEDGHWTYKEIYLQDDKYKLSLLVDGGSKTGEIDLSELGLLKENIQKIEVQIYANDGRDNGASDKIKVLMPGRDTIISEADSYGAEGFWYGCVVDGDGNYNDDCSCYMGANPEKCTYLNNLTASCTDGSACTRVMAFFNSSGLLESIKMGFVDNNPWGGGGKGTGRLREIKIHLRACPQVARVGSGSGFDTAAYTNKLWDKSVIYNSKTLIGPAVCKPYGSIGADSISNTVLLNLISDPSAAGGACNAGIASSIYRRLDPVAGMSALTELFARTFIVKELIGDGYSDVSSRKYDRRGDVSSISPAVPPQIQAYASGAQPSPGNDGKFTINNTVSGIVTSITGVATVNFYAWANENHMPLRGVQVYWGDGSNYSGSMDMLARNYKYKCEKKCAELNKNGSISSQSDHICSSDADCDRADLNRLLQNKCFTASFGDTAEACEERYWQFNHVYQCTDAIDADDGARDGFCKFTPKVRVKDNWGWYTNGVYGGDSDPGAASWISGATVKVPTASSLAPASTDISIIGSGTTPLPASADSGDSTDPTRSAE